MRLERDRTLKERENEKRVAGDRDQAIKKCMVRRLILTKSFTPTSIFIKKIRERKGVVVLVC